MSAVVLAVARRHSQLDLVYELQRTVTQVERAAYPHRHSLHHSGFVVLCTELWDTCVCAQLLVCTGTPTAEGEACAHTNVVGGPNHAGSELICLQYGSVVASHGWEQLRSASAWYDAQQFWQADAQQQPHDAVALANAEHVPAGNDASGFPETPKHKHLFPLTALDVLGWVIAIATIFIAAGAPPALKRTCMEQLVQQRFVRHGM